MVAFQLGASLAKGLFSSVGPVGAATLRLCIGGAILIAVVRPWRGWEPGRPLAPLALLGAGMAATILLFYLAIERIPLGVAIALQFLGPLTVAVASSRKPQDLCWAMMAGIGVWYLVNPSSVETSLDPSGVALALGAAIGWGGYIVLGRIVGNSFGRAAASLSLTLAGLLLLPLALFDAGLALFDLKIMPLAILVALLSGAIPFSLEIYALRRLPAQVFATFTSIEPAIAVTAGFVILDETLSTQQLAGVLLVVAAAAGSAWSTTRSAKVIN